MPVDPLQRQVEMTRGGSVPERNMQLNFAGFIADYADANAERGGVS
jgi:hypothetical protein